MKFGTRSAVHAGTEKTDAADVPNIKMTHREQYQGVQMCGFQSTRANKSKQ